MYKIYLKSIENNNEQMIVKKSILSLDVRCLLQKLSLTLILNIIIYYNCHSDFVVLIQTKPFSLIISP